MPYWTNRSLQGESDIDAIVALRLAVELADPSGFPISPERLRQEYLQPRPGWWSEVALWERGGEVRGISEVRISELQGGDRVAYLRLRIHPGDSNGALPGQMLAWCEQSATRYFGSGFQTETTVLPGHEWRIALLAQHGYAVDRVFNLMRRSLTEPIARSPEPAGYSLRPLQGVDEVEAWLSLYTNAFKDHYDFHPIAREERIQLMNELTYLPEFDLVTVSSQGELSAFSVCDRRLYAGGAVDWRIDLIGTHRDHRSRGLARWLISTTMGMAREHGGTEITLEVDASSATGANRLYERLGFVTTSASIDYRKAFGQKAMRG